MTFHNHIECDYITYIKTEEKRTIERNKKKLIKRKELDRLSIGINSKWLYILKAETIFISHTFIGMFNGFKYAHRIDAHRGRPNSLANHMHSTGDLNLAVCSIRTPILIHFLVISAGWLRVADTNQYGYRPESMHHDLSTAVDEIAVDG